MLRIPHCLDNRLTDCGKVVSPTHWQHPKGKTKQKNFIHPNNFNVTPRYNMCLYFNVVPVVIQACVQMLQEHDNPLIIEVGNIAQH
jgi:hypothetical protein